MDDAEPQAEQPAEVPEPQAAEEAQAERQAAPEAEAAPEPAPEPAAVPAATPAPQQPAKKGGVPLPLLLAGAAAMLAAGARALLRRRKTPGRPADWGALVAPLDLPPAPSPAPPAAPLPLAGLRFGVKDIFDVKGTVTGFGSPDWARTHAAATSHAAAVELLLAAGARATCKTVMDELAYSLSGENAHYGTPVNPAAPDRIPGGSSSGSAVAVAAGLVDFALGTDTGGSVRVPAAHCGIFGLRPTHGAVSVAGVVPMAPSFDTVGLFARDAATLRSAARVLLRLPPRSAAAAASPTRIVVAEDALALCGPEAVNAVAALLLAATSAYPGASASRVRVGALLAERAPSLAQFAPPPGGGGVGSDEAFDGLAANRGALRALQAWELWAAHGGWVAATSPALAPDVAARVAAAAQVPAAVAAAARGAREEAREALAAVLAGGALLCLPTVPTAPPKRGAPAPEADAWRSACLALLGIAGMAGAPQLHIPLGTDAGGMPVGVSLLGARGSDAVLLDAAARLAAPAAAAYAQRGAAARAAAAASAANGDATAAAAAASSSAAATSAPLSAAEACKAKGNAAFKAGRYAEAVAAYSAGLSKDTGNAVLLANRAMARLKVGDFKLAEEDCTACLAKEPRNVKALLRRGTARAFMGAYAPALSDFEAALALEPNNRDAAAEIERMRRLAGGSGA